MKKYQNMLQKLNMQKEYDDWKVDIANTLPSKLKIFIPYDDRYLRHDIYAALPGSFAITHREDTRDFYVPTYEMYRFTREKKGIVEEYLKDNKLKFEWL